jgi:uncharacterized protein YjbI with pentapeptide repeats
MEETTDFIGVNLERANLNEAKLKGADLRGAKTLDKSRLIKHSEIKTQLACRRTSSTRTLDISKYKLRAKVRE